MAKILDKTDSCDNNVEVPKEDNDATAQSIEVGLQSLANRTNKHKSDLSFLATGARNKIDGVKLLRRVVNLSALKNLVMGPANDGEFCYVDGSGLYRYDFANVNTTFEPVVVSPNLGQGRWLKKGTNQTLDVVDVIENGVASTLHSTIQTGITSLGLVDITGMSGTLENVREGDKILLSGVIGARLFVTGSPTIERGFVFLQIGSGAFTTVSIVHIGDIDNHIRDYHFSPKVFTVGPNTSTLTVKLAAKLDQAGLHLDIFSPAHVRAQIIRP